MENIFLCGVVWSVVILMLVIGFQAMTGILNNGMKWGVGARDTANDMTTLQGRANRTVANHVESMLLFIPLALVAYHVGGLADDEWAKKAVWLYLGGRAVYPLTYWAGLSYVRTIVWVVSIAGIIILLVKLLTAG